MWSLLPPNWKPNKDQKYTGKSHDSVASFSTKSLAIRYVSSPPPLLFSFVLPLIQDQVLRLRISCFYFFPFLIDWFHIVPKNFPQNLLSRSQELSFSSGYVFLIRISIVGILVGWRLVISIGFYDHLWEFQIDFLLCFVWFFVLFDLC